MIGKKPILLLTALWLLAACAGTPPPPAVTPAGDDRFLIDPRIGYQPAAAQSLNDRFTTAWRHLLAGNEAEAQRLLSDVRRRSPGYQPAMLAEVALDLRAGRTAAARTKLSAIPKQEGYTAADVYDAEIEARSGNTRAALDRYGAILSRGGAPAIVTTRVSELEGMLFNELYAAAQGAERPEAIRLLREALTFNPGAVDARVVLGRHLIAGKEFDEARRQIEPILDTAASQPGVQEILAEVAVGKGQYQEAIVRYERLVRSAPDPRYSIRLEEVKRQWSAANMPPHYHQAATSPALTRSELATLLYWTVPTVRFAQNLGAPPIATDIVDMEGRDEIVRAIAIGLYDVDPVTRRVSPNRQITAARLSAYLARVLLLRGAACSRGLTQEDVLAACRVTDPLAGRAADEAVSGAAALVMLEQVARAFE